MRTGTGCWLTPTSPRCAPQETTATSSPPGNWPAPLRSARCCRIRWSPTSCHRCSPRRSPKPSAWIGPVSPETPEEPEHPSGFAQVGSVYYPILVAVFTALVIISNVTATKGVAFGPIITDGGFIVFPLTYVIGDVLSEV